jgi:LuxR family maltose regulon positive regulatory protein
LDDDRRWYRYHHLFADLLRQRHNQTEAEHIPTYHIRAGEWFRSEGEYHEAIKHSLSAQDYESAAELIEVIGVDMLQQGNHATVSGWISEIPEEIVTNYPYLCVLHAWILQITGEVDRSETRLTIAEQAVESTGGPKDDDIDKTVGLLYYRRAYASFLTGEHEETISHAKNALDHLPESAVLIRFHTVLFLGLAHRNLGQLQAALDIYNSILHLTEQLGGTSVAVFHYIHIADLFWEMAQLQIAKEFLEKALSLTEHKTGRPDMPYCGFVYTRIGRILRQWNQLEDAFAYARKGHALCLEWNVVELLALSFIEVAHINLALGDREQALVSMGEAIRINENFSAWGKRFAEAHKAIMELSWGEIEYAESIVPAQDSLFKETYRFQREIEYLTLSRLLIAQKKFAEAKVLINRISGHAQKTGKRVTELTCLILLAKSFYAEGDTDQALEHLNSAFVIAKPEGFIRIFIDEGPPMAALLYEALSRESASEYVRQLLGAISSDEIKESAESQKYSGEFDWIEPLSQRELEVLQLIAEGLSNREIGDRLYLALNTVKTHTRNIYSKLGVRSRTQAVSKARAMGLM